MKKLPDEERFKHVDYHHTKLRLTFARVRKQQAEQAAREAQHKKVTPITMRKTK